MTFFFSLYYETFFTKMEKEKTDALEMAEKKA